MDRILLFSIIAALVAVTVPAFTTNRNFYLVSLAMVLAGGMISVWGNESSKTDFDRYISREIRIESASFRESDEALLIFAERQQYILPRQNLSTTDLDIVRREGPRLAGPATIWLRPNSDAVTGVAASQLSLDARIIAVRESSLYIRFRSIGIVISVFGLLLIPFHYFTTPKIGKYISLTQKY